MIGMRKFLFTLFVFTCFSPIDNLLADPNLVGWWKFDNETSPVINDWSGYGNHGIIVGDPVFVENPPRLGKVISLDGEGDWVDCGNGSVLDITHSVTLACWFKVEIFDKNWQTLLARGDDSYRLSRACWGGATHFGCTRRGMGRWPYMDGTIEVDDGKWHHIAGVYDGAYMYLYIDGILDTSMATTGDINISSYNLCIGVNSEYGQREFNGMIDDVRIYNRALSSSEVKKLADPSIVGWWKFDDESTSVVYDWSGYDNHGTIIGDPLFVESLPGLGRAISLDGKGDWLDCGSGSSLDITHSVTLACWFKVETFDKEWQTLLARGDDSYRLSRARSGGATHFGCTNDLFSGGAPWPYMDGTIEVDDGKWHHIAGVYDGAYMYLYIDGILDTSMATTGNMNISSYNLWIGENPERSGREFDGLLDDVCIYNRALSISEVKQLAINWSAHQKAAEKRLTIWKSYYDPYAVEPNKSGWLNPDFWDYLEQNSAQALEIATNRQREQYNNLDYLGTLLTVLFHDSGNIFTNMSGAGNLCLATILFGQLYNTMSFNVMNQLTSSEMDSDLIQHIISMVNAIEEEVTACQQADFNAYDSAHKNQLEIIKQINVYDGGASSLNEYERNCLYYFFGIQEDYYRNTYENLRHLIDSFSLWIQADHAFLCGSARWKVRPVLENTDGIIRSLGVGFMTEGNSSQIDSLYLALDIDPIDNSPEGWSIQQYQRTANTSSENWTPGVEIIDPELTTDYYQLDLAVCDAIDNCLLNDLRRDVCVLATESLGSNQRLWAYQYGYEYVGSTPDWRRWNLPGTGAYEPASYIPAPFTGGNASNTDPDPLCLGEDSLFFGLASDRIQEVYWAEAAIPQLQTPKVTFLPSASFTALSIGHGLDFDNPNKAYDQPYQLYAGTEDGYVCYFIYSGTLGVWDSPVYINSSFPLQDKIVALCAGPNGGTKTEPAEGTVFALTANALYAYRYGSSTGTWNRVELTDGSDFSGGISVGMCGAAVLASFNEGLYAFTRDAKGNWSSPKRVDNPDEHIYGRIVSDLIASGVRGAYIYNSGNIWNVIQVPNSKPKTPGDLSPQDEIWIKDITPELSWSSFADGGDGDTCNGYQLRVRCDTDGDIIVYDTGHISTLPYNTHPYDPAIYGGNYLVDGKHYHWHVRYQDSSGDWSDWSSDTPATHQDFYVDTSPDYITDLSAKLWEGGPELPPNVWRQENDPYFYWTAAVSDAPIEGYYHSLDSIPESSSDFTTNTYYEFPEDSVPDGERVFYVRAKDSAGNWGIPAGFNIKVDTTPPTEPLNIDSDNGDDGVWTTEQFHTMLWNPSDPGAGSPLVGYHYTTDGSDPDETSLSTTESSYGPYEPGFGVSYFKVRAKDLAGNLSNVATYTHKITYLGDFEPDGDVDSDDLARIADYWLEDESSIDIFPYPGGDNIINFKDFATFADNWLKGTIP